MDNTFDNIISNFPREYKKYPAGNRKIDGALRRLFEAVEKVLPVKGFGGKDSWKGNRQGSLSLKSTTF